MYGIVAFGQRKEPSGLSAASLLVLAALIRAAGVAILSRNTFDLFVGLFLSSPLPFLKPEKITKFHFNKMIIKNKNQIYEYSGVGC